MAERPDGLNEVWFAGVHSDVGGQYPDHRLSDIALGWMVEEAVAAGLRIDAKRYQKLLGVAPGEPLPASHAVEGAIHHHGWWWWIAGLGGAGADWSRLAVAAGATLAAILALYAVLWHGVVLSAGELAKPSPLFELVWQLHAGAFALALSALGTTFIGAALAAHASRLAAPWQRVLGVAGGGLLIAAGVANLAIADGSPILFVGLLGYATWLVWLLVTGVRLVLMPRKVGAA